MSSHRIKNYQKVLELVQKGITSPSVIMQSIASIKNWRTAKKYVNEAIAHLKEENNIDTNNEFCVMVEGLKQMKDRLLMKADEDMAEDRNLIGLTKQILGINGQLIKLLKLDAIKNTSGKSPAQLIIEQIMIKNE